MPLEVACPSCGKLFSASDEQRGLIVSCPGCEKKLRLPEPSSQAQREQFSPREPSPAASPAADRREVRSRAEDWDDDEPEFERRPRRRRAERKSPLGLRIGVGIGAGAVVAVAAVLLIVLAFNRARAPDVAGRLPGGPANEPGRHIEAGARFSYVPPPGWQVMPFAGLKNQVVTGPPANGFAPNVNFVDEVNNMDMRAYTEGNLAQLQRMFQQFRLIERQEFATREGLRGSKLVFEQHQANMHLRQCQYYFGQGSQKLVMTATVLAASGARFDPLLDECARSVRFE
jgi:hypothetical protein